VDNIKMDLGETGWVGVEWIGLAQDKDKCRSLVYAEINFRLHKCRETTEWLHNWWPLE
jgi:hypothetical protein